MQKPVLRISPSLLEQYRLVCLEKYGKTTEDLIDYIVGDFVPNIHTSRGSAYHQMIEHGPDKYARYPTDGAELIQTEKHNWEIDPDLVTYEVYEPDFQKTWVFTREAVQPIYDLRSENPDLINELWCDHWMESNGYDIRIRMKYDGMTGRYAHEFKTTTRSKKYKDYYQTVPWKIYCLANPELIAINFRIFKLNTKCTKCDVKRFQYRPYRMMEREIQSMIDGFVAWLQHYPELIEHLTLTQDASPWALS